MTKTCHIHIDDEVHARIAGLSPQDTESLWNAFGVFVDGYFHMPAFQLRRWDGKIRFFEKSGKTWVKLLDEIVPYVVGWGYEINLIDHRAPAHPVSTRIDSDYFQHSSFKFRPYQVDVVNALLDATCGFAICATGAGKTSMCAALCAVFAEAKLQTVVIVPSADLVSQTADEFEALFEPRFSHLKVGRYSGDSKDIHQPVVVATWQSLQNSPHYLEFFQALIVDESHGLKANVIKEMINSNGSHIAYRYGVTGTLPKPKADQYNLKLSIGSVVREVSAQWLIEQGYLAQIEIEPVELQDEDPDVPDYASEKSYLSKHDDRNEAIALLIRAKAQQYGNTLVLVNSIPQGQLLQELIPGSVFLFGESDKELREQNYKQYADQDGIIVIASMGIASTGISIDRIFCEVLVDVGKSFIRCIQAVGRGLRKKGDKNAVHVVDVHSRLKFSRKHFKERKKYYQEAGYPVNETLKYKY